MTRPVGVALVGSGGHQLSPDDLAWAGAEIVAVAEVAELESASVVDAVRALADRPEVDLVSVCAAPRRLQVDAAIAALEAGRHVLIERPAAAALADLERLEHATHGSAGQLWERATTPFEEPYRRAARLVADGAIGQVVLVTTHRSYPWADWRDADEEQTGGLVLQSAGYGLDVVRFVAGCRPLRLSVVDTAAGEPRRGRLRMAAVIAAELDGGAVASLVVDYLNPAGGPWGRDEVRILGTAGRLSIDAATRTIEWTDAGGEHREKIDEPGPGLVASIVAAVREGRDTDPPAHDLRGSTAALVRAIHGVGGSRRSFTEDKWPE